MDRFESRREEIGILEKTYSLFGYNMERIVQ